MGSAASGRSRVSQYIHNLLIAIDQFANTICGGDPDETISSRLGKAQGRGSRFACVLCRLLDVFDKNHCHNSVDINEGKDEVISIIPDNK